MEFLNKHTYTMGNDNNQAANQPTNQSIHPSSRSRNSSIKRNKTNRDETETSTSSNFCENIFVVETIGNELAKECERIQARTHAFNAKSTRQTWNGTNE